MHALPQPRSCMLLLYHASLQEPAKAEYLRWRAGQGPCPRRRAFCILQTPPAFLVIEAVVELPTPGSSTGSSSSSRVVAWQEVGAGTRTFIACSNCRHASPLLAMLLGRGQAVCSQGHDVPALQFARTIIQDSNATQHMLQQPEHVQQQDRQPVVLATMDPLPTTAGWMPASRPAAGHARRLLGSRGDCPGRPPSAAAAGRAGHHRPCPAGV